MSTSRAATRRTALVIPSAFIRVAQAVAGAVAFLLIYELAHAVGILPQQSTPTTAEVFHNLVDHRASLLSALGHTAAGWSLGLLLAMGVGVPIGVLIGLSRLGDVLTRPTIAFLRPIPSLALVPVVVVLLGVGLEAVIVLVAIAGVWPVLINTQYGVMATDPRLVDTARIAQFSRRAVVTRVVLPGAVPMIATGVRTSSSLAVIVAVATELVIGTPGLGSTVLYYQRNGDIGAAFAAIVVAGAFGVAAAAALARVERSVAGWHQHAQENR